MKSIVCLAGVVGALALALTACGGAPDASESELPRAAEQAVLQVCHTQIGSYTVADLPSPDSGADWSIQFLAGCVCNLSIVRAEDDGNAIVPSTITGVSCSRDAVVGN
jgi:hypothetical protein